MPELSNCKLCGKIFVKTTASVCPTCGKEQEKMFEKVYTYIRVQKNREATVHEVSQDTGVEEDLIHDWIKEGRLKTTGMPQMGYPCRSCGHAIKSGKFCDACGKQLNKELSTFDEQNKGIKEQVRTYYTKNEA
jgi:flagellar operon protein (TIGR03826 family)